jgi:hypothetical protein
MTTNGVPEILVSGNVVYSDSTNPAHTADSCACWSKASTRNAQKLLRKTDGLITCQDATAYAAMLAMSLDMLNHGWDVGSPDRLIQGWIARSANGESSTPEHSREEHQKEEKDLTNPDQNDGWF